MPKERFGAIFMNGKMVDIDDVSLLELRNISDELKKQESDVRKKLGELLKK